MLMDGGSQRSYVTERVKNALSLPTEKQQKMLIKTFGSEQEDERVCGVVRICMKTIDGTNIELPFFSVPLICDPLSHQPVAFCKTTYDHLSHLNLADFHEGHAKVKVDMLIGTDHYWKIATGEVVRGNSGPTVISTHLGWVLSGPTHCSDQCISAVNVITAPTLKIDSQEVQMKEWTRRYNNSGTWSLLVSRVTMLVHWRVSMKVSFSRMVVTKCAYPGRRYILPFPTNDC